MGSPAAQEHNKSPMVKQGAVAAADNSQTPSPQALKWKAAAAVREPKQQKLSFGGNQAAAGAPAEIQAPGPLQYATEGSTSVWQTAAAAKAGAVLPPAAARPAEESAGTSGTSQASPETGQEGPAQPAAQLTEADVDADVFKQLPSEVQRELRLSFMHAAASARLKAGKQPQPGRKAARPISGFFSQRPGQPTKKRKL